MFKIPVLVFLSLFIVACDSELTVQEHILNAKDFEESGEIKASVIELKNALQKNPENIEARWMLGRIYLDAGNDKVILYICFLADHGGRNSSAAYPGRLIKKNRIL